MPKFVIFVRATTTMEEAPLPKPSDMAAMGVYNSTLSEAGILLHKDGLLSSVRSGTRIHFHDSGAPTIQAGPFPANEIVAGFWIIEVKDSEEAVGWAAKAPFREGNVSEVRRIADLKEDFPKEE